MLSAITIKPSPRNVAHADAHNFLWMPTNLLTWMPVPLLTRMPVPLPTQMITLHHGGRSPVIYTMVLSLTTDPPLAQNE